MAQNALSKGRFYEAEVLGSLEAFEFFLNDSHVLIQTIRIDDNLTSILKHMKSDYGKFEDCMRIAIFLTSKANSKYVDTVLGLLVQENPKQYEIGVKLFVDRVDAKSGKNAEIKFPLARKEIKDLMQKYTESSNVRPSAQSPNHSNTFKDSKPRK